jgi:predicted HTH domain antitoxin
MTSLILELGDDLVALLHQLNQPLKQSVRELIVLEFYRRGTISSGKAAQLLDMPRWEFVRYASRLGIAFFEMTEDEWEMENTRSGEQ